MHTQNPITQVEMAKRLGISQGYLSRLLAGKRRPSLKVAEALAKKNGVHVLHVLNPDKYAKDGTLIVTATQEVQQ